MTREEFIKNFFMTEGGEVGDVWSLIPKTCSIVGIEYGLVGAIYDLQQQIEATNKLVDYLQRRLIYAEQGR